MFLFYSLSGITCPVDLDSNLNYIEVFLCFDLLRMKGFRYTCLFYSLRGKLVHRLQGMNQIYNRTVGVLRLVL